MGNKKRNISVRLSESDIKKIKDIADRFGIKESELFRYGVKCMLTKLMPFNDPELRGADLIPAWLESGQELLSYFYIDADQLENIFNNNIGSLDKKIDRSDLDLMVLSNLNERFVIKRLSEICGVTLEQSDVKNVLKKYLHDKYIRGTSCDCSTDLDWNTLINTSRAQSKELTN